MKNVWTRLCALGVMLTVSAVCLALPVDTAPILRGGVDVRQNAELEESLSLLQRGDRKQAKEKLAKFMARNRNDPRGLELAGLILLEEKNLRMAELAFKQSLANDPKRASAHSKLGVVWLMQGKLPQGETELRRALIINPNDYLGRRYLGWLEEQRGNPGAAALQYEVLLRSGEVPADRVTDLHVALARDYNAASQQAKTVQLLRPLRDRPADAPELRAAADALLAYADIDTGNLAEASALVKALQKSAAKNPELPLLEGRLLAAQGKLDEASAKFSAAADANPAIAAAARFQWARILIQAGQWDRGKQALEKLMREAKATDLPAIAAEWTTAHIARGEARKGLPLLEQVTEANQRVPLLKYLLAQLQLAANDVPNAATSLNRFMQVDPNYPPAYSLAGLIAQRQNKLDVAQQQLNRAVQLDPRNLDAWIALANVHLQAKRLDKAGETLREATRWNPNNPALLFEIGSYYDVAGNLPEANNFYRKTLAIAPNDVRALNNLAINLLDSSSNANEALSLAQRAYRLAPGNATVEDTYGWALVMSGDLAKGLPLLEQSYRRQPNDGAANYHLGAAYLKLGRAAEARPLLDKASKADLSPQVRAKIKALL